MSNWFVNLGANPLFPAVSVFLSVLIGALVTLVAARKYYERSGDDLKREAASLHEAVNFVLTYLENRAAGIKVERDSNGRVVRLIFDVQQANVPRLGIAVHSTSVEAKPAEPDR